MVLNQLSNFGAAFLQSSLHRGHISRSHGGVEFAWIINAEGGGMAEAGGMTPGGLAFSIKRGANCCCVFFLLR